MKNINVRDKILDTAENLIQTRGYNAFSYRDIAELIGIKTSSIHYYFPTKGDLGKAVVQEHLALLYAGLNDISLRPLSCQKMLDVFFDTVFDKTYFSDKKMCLGGMLASDVFTLPEDIQEEVRLFFKKIQTWLEKLLLLGKSKKEFYIEKNVQEEALFILTALEGALLLARLYQDEKVLKTAKKQIRERLTRA